MDKDKRVIVTQPALEGALQRAKLAMASKEELVQVENNISALSAQVEALSDRGLWIGTQSEYDALGVYSERELYFIVEEDSELLSTSTGIWIGSQEEFNALANPAKSKIYFITD